MQPVTVHPGQLSLAVPRGRHSGHRQKLGSERAHRAVQMLLTPYPLSRSVSWCRVYGYENKDQRCSVASRWAGKTYLVYINANIFLYS